MGIWDLFLQKTITPLVRNSIKELTNEGADLQKIMAMNTQNISLPYQNGQTRRKLDQGVSFQTLRDLATYYPVLRSCVNYRKREMSKLEWDIVAVDTPLDVKERESVKADADEVKRLFRHPTGDKNITFREFLSKIMEDLLILDAIAIYRRQNRRGGIYGYLPVDSATIELVMAEDGTTPTPPNVAYIQVIDGHDVAKLTTDELIYRMLNPRTHNPYGLSPVETLIITVSTALRLGTYNLAFLSEGNIPEGFVELPKDVASNPDQLKLWQEAWDAMVSGRNSQQRKLKFLPEGMKYTAVRKPEEMEYKRFEEWLLLNTCSVMEVPPQAIGFQFDRGKGATEAEWEIGKERSAFPTANFLREIFDQIIQEDLKQEHLRFVWTNINPTNKKEEAEVFGQLVRLGAVSVDEWRVGEGMEPIGMDHFIMTPVGPIMVKDFKQLSDAGQNPFIPVQSEQADSDMTPPGFKSPKSADQKNNPNPAVATQKKALETRKEQRAEAIYDLKNWRKIATKDIMSGKRSRPFISSSIDHRTQQVIADGLKTAKSKVEVYNLFNPYISGEGEVLSAVIDLYGEINDIIKYGSSTGEPN